MADNFDPATVAEGLRAARAGLRPEQRTFSISVKTPKQKRALYDASSLVSAEGIRLGGATNDVFVFVVDPPERRPR